MSGYCGTVAPEPMIDRILTLGEAGADYDVLRLERYTDAETFRAESERFATQVILEVGWPP